MNKYVALARACAEAGDLNAARVVQARVANEGLHKNVWLANGLLAMYGTCGDLASATSMFWQMEGAANVFSWTLLMAANAQNGHPHQAVHLFWAMLAQGVKPDRVSLLGLVDAAAAAGLERDACRCIHWCIGQSGFMGHVVLGNALVNMYGKCGCPDEAKHVLDAMPHRNVISWTALIVAYAENHRGREALQCLARMDAEGVKANNVTLLAAVDVCGSMRLLTTGRLLHDRIDGIGLVLESEPNLGAALINMYGKCGSLGDMETVFEMTTNARCISSWTSMMSAYIANGQRHDAVVVMRRMDLEGVKANKITFATMLDLCCSLSDVAVMEQRIVESDYSSSPGLATSLVSLYGKLGCLDVARQLVQWMLHEGSGSETDVVVWNAMITACAHNAQVYEALHFIRNMELRGVRPNKVTLLAILDACAESGALQPGRNLHTRMSEMKMVEAEEDVWNSLANMYAKCGQAEEARRVFTSRRHTNTTNIVSWNVVIGACVLGGEDSEAWKLFHVMELEGVRPNRVTLIALLDACCCHANVKAVEARMEAQGVNHETLVCNSIVKAYARCGHLVDAKHALDEMRDKGLADITSWTALLSGYAQNRQGKMALFLFRQMQLEGIAAVDITFVSALDACATLVSLTNGREIHAWATEAGFSDSSASVANTLINLYGKCGTPQDSKAVFDAMAHNKSTLSWHSLVSAYASNGHVKEAMSVFGYMMLDGMLPDNGTFVAILSACSHAGLLAEGVEYFQSVREHQLEPTDDMYKCIADLLGRKGLLAHAEDLLLDVVGNVQHCMQEDIVAWMLLLAACKSYCDVERGIRAAWQVLELQPDHGAAYVLLSQLYGSNNNEDVEEISVMN